MSKRIFALILAVLMTAAVFAGCTGPVEQSSVQEESSKPVESSSESSGAADENIITLSDGSTYHYNETGYPITDEPISFTMWIQHTSDKPEEFPIFKLLSEATNVYPEYVVISPTAAEEKMSLMWASQDYPDVITGDLIKSSDIDTYAPSGIIQPVDQYFDTIMPNFQTVIQDFELDLMKSADGHCYYYPTINSAFLGNGLAINTKWLETLGLDVPNTLDEFYDVLVAFRDKDPNGNGKNDEIPFGAELIWSDTLDSIEPFMGAFGCVGGWQVSDDGKVFWGQTTDSYKEGVKYLRKLYSEGLIDAEFFTQDMTGFKAKAQTNPSTYGCVLSFVYSAASRCCTADNVGEYANMLPLKNSDGVRLWQSSGPASSVGPTLIVTSSCEIPQVIARWCDYMYDPNIGWQIDYAPLGIGYEKNETTGLWTKIENPPEGYESVMDWYGACHYQRLPRILTVHAQEVTNNILDISEDLIETAYQGRDKLYRDNCEFNNYFPQIPATEEETETLNIYSADVDKIYRETISGLITGTADIDSAWDSYLAQLEAAGLSKITEVYQAQYDRYIGK